jgi:uncharacterized Zn finger protein
MSWFPKYKKTSPRTVRGGIKAHNRQGSFGKSWWAKRWLAVLESFDLGARLSRGKSYARRGQVISLHVAKGAVTAKVQGSQAKPYAVTITITPLSDNDWQKLAHRLRSQAIFSAKLLSGEMPNEIEAVFKEAGLSLFPSKGSDLHTSCSCPDWVRPCKHVAAVYCLLAEEFDRDPFLIFTLRGITRDEFLVLLEGDTAVPSVSADSHADKPSRGKDKPKVRILHTAKAAIPERKQETATARESLPTDSVQFWRGRPFSAASEGSAPTPVMPASLLQRLGPFPLWRGEQDLHATLAPMYKKTNVAASELLAKLSEQDRHMP